MLPLFTKIYTLVIFDTFALLVLARICHHNQQQENNVGYRRFFSEEDDPYTGDVLFINFLNDHCRWVKVEKSDRHQVRKYLQEQMNFVGSLDIKY